MRQKYKDEENDLMQCLIEIIMKPLNGVQIRKDINECFSCKTEHWMETKYDDNQLDYWKLRNGN